MRGAHDPMHAGEVVTCSPAFGWEVVAVAEGGSPSRMTFTFDRSLDDPSMRWMTWKDGGYVPFLPPPVGQAVDLAPVTMKP